MTRRSALSIAFVGLGVTWTVWEIVAAQTPGDDLVPLTTLLVDYIPAPVTFAAVALLVAWIGPHFVQAYANRKAATMNGTDPSVIIPATPQVGASREPLLSVGWITAAAGALIGLAVAFGMDLTQAQTGAVLTLATVLAPMIVAGVGRRHVYAPSTVRAMVLDAARTGETRNEAAQIPTPPAEPVDGPKA
jgi:hypothetical protein